jgi:hypothetical protein
MTRIVMWFLTGTIGMAKLSTAMLGRWLRLRPRRTFNGRHSSALLDDMKPRRCANEPL